LGALHAGPLLFGDWGTSRLYVLGLAFAAVGNAAPIYLVALSVLMAAVAWAYTIICRCFPDGGGVYTSARRITPMLGVFGGTLLLADYIVTAAISLIEAFHYFGVPKGPGGMYIYACCVATIAGLGALNWLGARSSGRFALTIAVLAMGFSALIALAALPFLPEGVRNIDWDPAKPLNDRWISFVAIILALSGVEAVSNMTGLMKKPVERTAKRTIWPVLGEVATLNIIFGIALVGLIALAARGALGSFDPSTEQSQDLIKHAAMKVLAIELGQHWAGETLGFVLGKASAVVFGLLLISAANTAIMAIVSVLYAMTQDRELPGPLARLNYSGVPWMPLIIACVLPAAVLAVWHDLQSLASLYAIGVVGAITMNVICCAVNRQLPISRPARVGLLALGLFMLSVWLTIAITKPEAAAFAFGLTAAVLAARFVARARGAPEEALPEPVTGWLAEVRRGPVKFDPSKPRVMLAARGRDQSQYAVDLARRRGATLFAVYVRTLRVMDYNPARVPKIEDDKEAQEALGTTSVLAAQAGVPFVPIYLVSPDIAGEILDYTVTFGCDTLIMGKSRRSVFSRRVAGDVVGRVAEVLPPGVTLLTRAAGEAAEFVPTGPAAG
jgi:amino acid transporter/nucleotide-binding universal stress UspA family protein